jgi:hypothetical protein
VTVKRRTNNDGRNQIKRGKTYGQVKRIARRLRLRFSIGDQSWRNARSALKGEADA